MTITTNSLGLLAKVSAICNDGETVCFDLRTGQSGSFTTTEQRYEIGDVVLLTGNIEKNSGVDARIMPKHCWPDALWIGIVKIKLSDLTIIDAGGRFRPVPTVESVAYDVGNTVQASDTEGVTRVLSESPLKYIDFPQLDDSVIQQFLPSHASTQDIGFENFGGLPTVVTRARELIEIPLQRGELLAEIGVRPIKGVLFTGAPGTGKTMLARIIASQCGATFYEISGPEIFSKWFGQSEELLRKIFKAAAEHEKTVIFFDEIDSVAAQRDDRSHEASKRVVAQLLTLMDGFSSQNNVIVIAATNRPQDLDIALRRPGRFDWEIEFPYPDERDRRDILEKSARNLKTASSLPHAEVAAKSDGWSAAELVQIWPEAALLAIEDERNMIMEEDYIGGFERVLHYRVRAGTDKTSWENK